MGGASLSVGSYEVCTSAMIASRISLRGKGGARTMSAAQRLMSFSSFDAVFYKKKLVNKPYN